MKAAIYYALGDMRYEDVPDPKCTPEGAIVKIGGCGVCHVMDVDAWIRWARGVRVPDLPAVTSGPASPSRPAPRCRASKLETGYSRTRFSSPATIVTIVSRVTTGVA